MASNTSIFPRPKRYDRTAHRILIQPNTGLAASATSGLTCGSNEVFLVDKIEFSTISADAAANTTIFLTVNGVRLPFHFPGTANAQVSRHAVWRTRGNLVVRPGQSITAHCSTAGVAAVSVHGHYMNVTKAYSLWRGGSMPNVASTNAVAAGGLVAGVAKNIIPGVAGRHVEILGFAYTGHAYSATSNSARIGFWDGTTGSFDANSNRFFKAFSMGANKDYAPDVLIGDTEGCIQGAESLGVYVDSTINLCTLWTVAYDGQTSNLTVGDTLTFSGGGTALLVSDSDSGATGTITFRMISGAVPADNETFTDAHTGNGVVNGTPAEGSSNGDYIVLYRYVDSADCANTAGTVGSTGRAQKFWVYTEAALGAVGASVAMFSSSLIATNIMLLGHAVSCTSGTGVLGPATVGLGIGADSTLPIADFHVCFADGGGNTVSSSFYQEDVDTNILSSLAPSFIGLPTTTVARGQLVWGRMDLRNPSVATPANLVRFV